MDTNTLTATTLAGLFDHTYLKPFATNEDFDRLCQEALKIHACMVAINSSPVTYCKNILKDSGVHVGAAIAFPLGQTSIASKLAETLNAIEDGADEIDYVINIGEAKMHHWAYLEEEMKTLVDACHARNILIKVIFENCYLEKAEIIELAKIAKKIKPDYIKTSTGFGTSGATIEDVKLMKSIVEDDVLVKAAGGIRDWPTCKAMLEAGASRIGTSSSLKILDEFNHR